MTLPIGEPRTAGRRVVRRRFVPQNVGRMKVVIPNGLTLGNLFFGINAIIAASRGDFNHACLFVVLGGVCDAFDGAAARATRTGGRFGEELDSLVDAISFGLAPAMIVHFSTLTTGQPGWNVAVFFFAACAVIRLARFNITQAGGSKTYFQGLPSPAAGGTLATYWWFSQTPFYQSNAAIVDLPWNMIMQLLMIGLGILMISDVPYPAWPKIGLRSWKGVLGLAGMLFLVFGVFYWRSAFFFPFGIAYVTYGLLRGLLLGMWDRRPRRDAYTGAPLPRRGTPRSSAILPAEADELDASDLLDPDEIAVEEEYDFFEDEEELPARPVRSSGSMRVVRAGRPESPERAAERADRAERLEKRKKRKKKERLEQRAALERGEPRSEPRAEARPARTPSAAEQPTVDRAAGPRAEPRPPRPPRDVPRPDRQDRPERPGIAEAATSPAGEGEDSGDADGGDDNEAPRDGAPRSEGERRKRRKRRRGNRAPGDAPTTMDVAPDAGSAAPSGGAPITPPFAGPRPFSGAPPFSEPSAPAAPASPPPPPPAPDFREDRSE